MKFFTQHQLLTDDDVSTEGPWIAAQVLQTLATSEHTGMSRLLHVGVHDGNNDSSLYEVRLEIAPGLEISARAGLPEDLASDMTDGEREAVKVDAQDSLVEWVEETLETCTPQADELAEIVHQARLKTRRVLAEWNRDGAQARMSQVHLAPLDHWKGKSEPALVILLEAPGDRLKPETIEVEVETLDSVETDLSGLRDGIARRCARSVELMAAGATGTISRMALNAIDSFGDREATLRRFAEERRFWLPDDTALLILDGDVQAGSGRTDDPIDWYAGSISLDAQLVDGARLRNAVGQPANRLIDFEYLSDDIIVTDVSNVFDDGRARLVILLDMPRLLFCSITGRVWEADRGDATNRVSTGADSGNVVPFRKRAG